jgi:hypothetical protein
MAKKKKPASIATKAAKLNVAGSPIINNLVVVSDTHCGCRLALCHPDGATLDDGGTYKPSPFQLKIYSFWQEFWDVFVPEATRGEPFTVVHNGDAIDGVHHGSTTQVSNNLDDQGEIAFKLMEPIVERCEGRYYHIRGTEAHVGKSACEEERLAKRLGAIPNEQGQYARYDLWKYIGEDKLVHLLHHVGSTGSQAYESTAVHKELTESFLEAGRWNRRAPNMIVRSHRHRAFETNMPTSQGKAFAVVTACWQGKTPFVWKIPGARISTPQFGGVVIRVADGELFTRPYVKTVEHSKAE